MGFFGAIRNVLAKILFEHITIARWQFKVFGLFMLTIGASIGAYVTTTQYVIPKLFAAPSPWSQTDWIGGTSSGTVAGTVTSFASQTNIDTSVSGEFKLSGAAIATLKGNQLSDDSTNFNVANKTALKYNTSQDYNDSVFSYDVGSPTRLTVDSDGNYFFSLTIPIASDSIAAGNRNGIEAEIRVNGSKVDIGVGRSTYIRNSSQNESSGHLTGYLPNLSAGDYIEVFIVRTTTQTTNTLTGNFTFYAEQIEDNETIFWASGTRTDAGTNLNGSESAMQWTEIVEDTGYTHTEDSSTVRIDSSGNYFVSVNIPLGGSVTRGNITGRIKLDGSLVDGGIMQQGYIRNGDAHTDSSLHWSGVVTTNLDEQDLQITVEQEASGGTITTDGEKATLYIQKLPDSNLGIYHGEATTVDSGSNWNPADAAIDWATDNILDTNTYTKADTQTISVDSAGDYLVAFNWAGTSSGTRVNPIGKIKVNGSVVTGAETKTGYMRQSGHNNASGSLLIPILGLSADDDITVTMDREGATTFTNDSTPGVLMVWQKGYASSGTLTSNIFDAGFPADWGIVTYSSSGTGNVTVKVRTDNQSDMSGAPDWSTCSGISSGADISADSCVTDTDQYLQYQVTLESVNGQTPIFEDISIAFQSTDQDPPVTNAKSIQMFTDESEARDIPSNPPTGSWNNATEPYFTWDQGADNVGGVGLLGYCIYLGTSETADPATTSGLLQNSPVTTAGTNCGFIVEESAAPSLDLSDDEYLSSALADDTTYYLNIKAVDIGYNMFGGSSAQFIFRHDESVPTNVGYISAPGQVFSNVDDMNFSWPDTASDGESGVLGYQYQIGGTGGTWKGTTTHSDLDLDYIPSGTTTHSLTQDDDADDISVGNNIVYFRTIDNAGNPSAPASYRTANLAFGGDAPSFAFSCESDLGITATPASSTTNSFTFDWDDASPASGQSIETYYYMINVTPPALLSTMESNTATYIPTTDTSIPEGALSGVNKGENTIYVVAVDDDDNYSASNCIKTTFDLDSENPDPPANLTVSDASIKSSSLWRASLAWEEPDYTGTGDLTYKIERSTDSITWTDVATTSGSAYVDTVDSSQAYYWRVAAYDTSSESIASPSYANAVTLTPKGTYTEPPTLTSDPVVSGITTQKATISWTTDRTSDSKVQYGVAPGEYFDEEPSTSDQVTSHEISLTNLDPGTTYYYRARWTDEDGNTGESDEYSFTTDPAPVVTEPQISAIGLTSASITFTVTGASGVKVYYGQTNAFGGAEEISTATSENTYTVTLDGLDDGTKYFYKINTFDIEDEEYEGDILSFETLPRPRISSVRVQQVKGTAQPTVLVSWETNTAVSSIVTYYPQGNPAAARDEVNVALKEGEHQMIVRGLLPNTQYAMIVKGRDRLGNEAQSDIQNVTTATDTRPPKISNLKVEGSIQTGNEGPPTAQLIVSWDTDEPATSQVEYGEGTGTTYSQRSQEDSSLTFNHVVIISGLTPSKVYHLRALSKDSEGNESKSVDTVTITPKATRSALDLVINNLSEAFGFLRGI